MKPLEKIQEEAILLLKDLIKTPSLSKEEDDTAVIISSFFKANNIPFKKKGNNIWATNLRFDPKLPTVLLNSHHDTVKPNKGYTRDPFSPETEDGKLYGLGSNDAGGCLVSLIGVFVHFYDMPLPCNLILAATAEEEISGKNGIESVLPELPELELAIVGEPTQMQVAVAEKGLMVIDATVMGKAGHAARDEGINAIYKALDDLETLRKFQFKKLSDYLGPSKVTVTVIQAGSQHNVIPDQCTFTLDVRLTDAYTHEEALEELSEVLQANLKPRSLRLKSSRIDPDHSILTACRQLGIKSFGSPTLSDQALIPYPSIKIGPGDSARSHTPDEYIQIEEIHQGILLYIKLLQQYFSLH